MGGLTRRGVGRLAGAAALGLVANKMPWAREQPKVVVVGGGAGGATAARYLAAESGGALEVTLIEAKSRYASCFFSNLYLGGFRTFESITHGYDGLSGMSGIRIVNDRADRIERDGRAVVLADGTAVPYDRLVLAPGIDIIHDSVPGYSQAAASTMPHAWTAGPQTRALKARLDALEDGQQIVIVAPPNSYRCPPGPYERASMMAHVLKSKGYAESSIVIIDPKPKFSKQALFQQGWATHYPGMIEWYGPDVHGGIAGVVPETGSVETDFDTFRGALVNVIPAQRAGRIASGSGLADDSGFCPVDAGSMRSTLDPNIFVIGDAAIAGDMPKSGFSANSQAKVAAMAVRGDLLGSPTYPARYFNTCWSLIGIDDGVKVGARYEAVDNRIAAIESYVSQTGEDAATRKATYAESVDWYRAIVRDMFGA